MKVKLQVHIWQVLNWNLVRAIYFNLIFFGVFCPVRVTLNFDCRLQTNIGSGRRQFRNFTDTGLPVMINHLFKPR